MSDKPKRMTKRYIGKGQPLPLDEEPATDFEQVFSAPITDKTDTVTDNRLGSGENREPANPIDSDAKTDSTEDTERSTPQTTEASQPTAQGEVPLPVAGPELVDGCTVVGPYAHVIPGERRKDCWERLRKEARAAGLNRRQAMWWANRETERLFPPPAPEPEPVEEPPPAEPAPTIVDIPEPEPPAPTIVDIVPSASSDQVSGLGDLPAGWGQLPANASLQAEIAWVSANRLRVRSGSGVDLSRALSPAPSYAALSWLETSILFPSKFADISVKATAGQEDEREGVRREKLAIDEIRALLAEMLEG